MKTLDLRKSLYTLLAFAVAGVVGLQLNVIGHAAFALEQATLEVIDGRLPTQQQVDDLARVNRLVARKALAAVVYIVTQTELPENHRRFLKRLPIGPIEGQGSGVIIDAQNGYILTNHHVIDEADTITVQLADGRQYPANRVGTDPPTDLAVLQIDADQLFELPLGDSNALQVGDPVMTVGNPFGYEGTVSKGIVSAIGRNTAARIIDYEGFIQTDAVINPGNSGGPLVNMRAEIMGINTAMETRTGTFNGVGFAIPSARINRLLPSLLKGEKIVRGYLGIVMSDVRANPRRAQQLGWENTHGVFVNTVIEESPADSAGLRAGDILARLNGAPVADIGDIGEQIAFTTPGSSISLEVWRDRRLLTLQPTVDQQPANFSTRGFRIPDDEIGPLDRFEELEETEIAGVIPELGMTVEMLNRGHIARYDLDEDLQPGVVVTAVEPDSLAQASNIQPGDVILTVNGRRIRGLRHMAEELEALDLSDGVRMQLRNSAMTREVTISPSH